MDKLRVGVIVDLNFSPEIGGGYSYYHRLMMGIDNFQFSPSIEIINIIFYQGQKPATSFAKESIFIEHGYGKRLKTSMEASYAKPLINSFAKRNWLLQKIYNTICDRRDRTTEAILQEKQIDIVYYLKPSRVLGNYPFIITHWDVGHKTMYAFPETSISSIYKRNIEYYSYTLGRAFMIFCESHTGADELKKTYPIFPDKIKVLPIFAGEVIDCLEGNENDDVLRLYNLGKERYFLYPAQFWPHKNHYNLLLAFKELLNDKTLQDLKLVLCGSDHGNMAYIRAAITSLSLEGKVILPGFLPLGSLKQLYRNAVSLVMPTFLGPTNLPLIEAAHLGCPVLCTDLKGHRELMGDNAVYFDASDPSSMKTAMQQILNKEYRDQLIQAAKDHIAASPFNLHHCLEELDRLLNEAMVIRRTWGKSYPG